jgi:hypothetical protein
MSLPRSTSVAQGPIARDAPARHAPSPRKRQSTSSRTVSAWSTVLRQVHGLLHDCSQHRDQPTRRALRNGVFVVRRFRFVASDMIVAAVVAVMWWGATFGQNNACTNDNSCTVDVCPSECDRPEIVMYLALGALAILLMARFAFGQAVSPRLSGVILGLLGVLGVIAIGMAY